MTVELELEVTHLIGLLKVHPTPFHVVLHFPHTIDELSAKRLLRKKLKEVISVATFGNQLDLIQSFLGDIPSVYC